MPLRASQEHLPGLHPNQLHPAPCLRQIRATATANDTAAAALGNQTDEHSRMLPFGDDRFTEAGHKNHLALVRRIRQTTDHQSTTLAQLMTQALCRTLKTAFDYTSQAPNQ